MFSKSDLKRLENKASVFVSECRPRHRVIEVFYRNKPGNYFTDIKLYSGGVMKPLLKDHNGDPRCPINNKIAGLFFMGKLGGKNKSTADGLPDASPFGERRVKVPAGKIFKRDVNLYFSDFWCHKEVHYVSLVITRPGSSTDKFCKTNLLELDIVSNKYLKLARNGQVEMLHGYTFWTEIFYTEPINLNSPGIEYSTVDVIGRGHTTLGGIRKNPNCTVCNISVPNRTTPRWESSNLSDSYRVQSASADVRQRSNLYNPPTYVPTQRRMPHQPEENNGGISCAIILVVAILIAVAVAWKLSRRY